MTEIQQQSLYGKCSWRADYGRKVKVVELNLARRASGQVWQLSGRSTRSWWLNRAVQVEETEGPLSSVGWCRAPGNGCSSGGLRRWTFWRPLVHRMILAGAAFPRSIQSSRVSWIKVCRTTPVEVGGKPGEWSKKPWWAIWWANLGGLQHYQGQYRCCQKHGCPKTASSDTQRPGPWCGTPHLLVENWPVRRS